MPITDAFTGTNGTGIVAYSSNWAYVIGATTDLQIQSNSLAAESDSAERCAQRTETTFPSNHYSQGTLVAVYAFGGDTGGVSVRCQGSASQQYYGFYADATLSQLFEENSGTWTQLGSNAGGFAANDVIKLTVSGTTLTPNKNGSTTGTPGAQTDATFSGGAPGVCWFKNAGAIGDTRLDNFECSDVTSTAVRQLLLLGIG